jgi:hypothetical protein
MSREDLLRQYGVGTYAEFMAAERDDAEAVMDGIIFRSKGERTCCADPDCPVWSDEWLNKEEQS